MVEEVFEEHTHITKTNRRVKHHRPEISADFEFLETKGLIKKINTDPGPGLVYGRGRPKTYYAITEGGLKALLADENLPAATFWKILRGYCLNNDELVPLDKVEEFYQIVIGRYLKYYYHGFSSQLDSFHDMCARWLEETIFKSDKITTAQKVIEVLAVNPKITLAQLLQKTGVPKSNLYQIHQLLLANSYMSMPLPDDNEQYADFLIHNIITIKLDDEPTYDLSLFGVILLFVLIRYNEAGKLKCGLHFKDFSVQQYYDKIALKHKVKLPLIFGKWNQLKRILKAFTAHNLDIVLNRERRSDNGDSHFVNVGGNKEVYEGIRGIILYNGKLMRDFEAAGWEILKGHIEAMSSNNSSVMESSEFKKIFPLCAKFEEVIMLSRPTWYIFPNLSIIGSKTRNSDIVLGRRYC